CAREDNPYWFFDVW
nr:immunoglobulin heavy chain junction region [Mus musculus]